MWTLVTRAFSVITSVHHDKVCASAFAFLMTQDQLLTNGISFLKNDREVDKEKDKHKEHDKEHHDKEHHDKEHHDKEHHDKEHHNKEHHNKEHDREHDREHDKEHKDKDDAAEKGSDPPSSISGCGAGAGEDASETETGRKKHNHKHKHKHKHKEEEEDDDDDENDDDQASTRPPRKTSVPDETEDPKAAPPIDGASPCDFPEYTGGTYPEWAKNNAGWAWGGWPKTTRDKCSRSSDSSSKEADVDATFSAYAIGGRGLPSVHMFAGFMKAIRDRGLGVADYSAGGSGGNLATIAEFVLNGGKGSSNSENGNPLVTAVGQDATQLSAIQKRALDEATKIRLLRPLSNAALANADLTRAKDSQRQLCLNHSSAGVLNGGWLLSLLTDVTSSEGLEHILASFVGGALHHSKAERWMHDSFMCLDPDDNHDITFTRPPRTTWARGSDWSASGGQKVPYPILTTTEYYTPAGAAGLREKRTEQDNFCEWFTDMEITPLYVSHVVVDRDEDKRRCKRSFRASPRQEHWSLEAALADGTGVFSSFLTQMVQLASKEFAHPRREDEAHEDQGEHLRARDGDHDNVEESGRRDEQSRRVRDFAAEFAATWMHVAGRPGESSAEHNNLYGDASHVDASGLLHSLRRGWLSHHVQLLKKHPRSTAATLHLLQRQPFSSSYRSMPPAPTCCRNLFPT